MHTTCGAINSSASTSSSLSELLERITRPCRTKFKWNYFGHFWPDLEYCWVPRWKGVIITFSFEVVELSTPGQYTKGPSWISTSKPVSKNGAHEMDKRAVSSPNKSESCLETRRVLGAQRVGRRRPLAHCSSVL
eukprot:scaffold42675_cov34-Prasinocladus_malaysianus.AAC.2